MWNWLFQESEWAIMGTERRLEGAGTEKRVQGCSWSLDVGTCPRSAKALKDIIVLRTRE